MHFIISFDVKSPMVLFDGIKPWQDVAQYKKIKQYSNKFSIGQIHHLEETVSIACIEFSLIVRGHCSNVHFPLRETLYRSSLSGAFLVLVLERLIAC